MKNGRMLARIDREPGAVNQAGKLENLLLVTIDVYRL